MITVDEIVGLLQSRDYPVDFKDLQNGKSSRVKLSNGYSLFFFRDLVTGEYQAYFTHNSILRTTWNDIDVSSLTSALDYAEAKAGVVPDNSIKPVQQSAIAHGSEAMPLVATAFAISFAIIILSIGIVTVKFKTCNVNIPQPEHSTVKDR